MKSLIFSAILFCAIILPARAELTDADLNKIRLIVKEEIKEELKPIKDEIAILKTDVATLKTDVAWMRGKLEGVDKQFASVDKQFASIDKQFASVDRQITHVTNITYGLIALIVAAIAIPQIILTWRSVKDRQQQQINQELRQEIEALKQRNVIRP